MTRLTLVAYPASPPRLSENSYLSTSARESTRTRPSVGAGHTADWPMKDRSLHLLFEFCLLLDDILSHFSNHFALQVALFASPGASGIRWGIMGRKSSSHLPNFNHTIISQSILKGQAWLEFGGDRKNPIPDMGMECTNWHTQWDMQGLWWDPSVKHHRSGYKCTLVSRLHLRMAPATP